MAYVTLRVKQLCISVLVKTVSKQVILAQTITAMIYGCYLYTYVCVYGGIRYSIKCQLSTLKFHQPIIVT